MKRTTVRWSLLTVVLTLFCVLTWAMPAAAITNGTLDAGHPYVCLVQLAPDWRVTGVQLSSTVVLTAGHGTYGFDASKAQVWFSPQVDLSVPGIVPAKLVTYPGYASGQGDVGIVILKEPHVLNEYAQLPELGIVDTLPMKQSVDLVGYGANYQLRGGGLTPFPSWQWLNQRQYAPAQLIPSNDKLAGQYLKFTANPSDGKGGIAFGDSGGPVLKAGTNVVLAVNTFVTSANCTGISYAQRLDLADIQTWIGTFL